MSLLTCVMGIVLTTGLLYFVTKLSCLPCALAKTAFCQHRVDSQKVARGWVSSEEAAVSRERAREHLETEHVGVSRCGHAALECVSK